MVSVPHIHENRLLCKVALNLVLNLEPGSESDSESGSVWHLISMGSFKSRTQLSMSIAWLDNLTVKGIIQIYCLACTDLTLYIQTF